MKRGGERAREEGEKDQKSEGKEEEEEEKGVCVCLEEVCIARVCSRSLRKARGFRPARRCRAATIARCGRPRGSDMF